MEIREGKIEQAAPSPKPHERLAREAPPVVAVLGCAALVAIDRLSRLWDSRLAKAITHFTPVRH